MPGNMEVVTPQASGDIKYPQGSTESFRSLVAEEELHSFEPPSTWKRPRAIKIDKDSPVSVLDFGSDGPVEDCPHTPRTPMATTPSTPHCPTDTTTCPKAPAARRAHIERANSLLDTRLLMTTQNKLERSNSAFMFDSHFEFIKLLGKGAFSEVHLARHYISGALYAVKVSIHQFHSKADRKRYMHEVESVAALPAHDNIVKYMRGWQQYGKFYIQMEYLDGGSLYDAVKNSGGRLEERRVWQILKDISSGLAHIHSNQVLHLDLKPENIFLDAQGNCKIGDFGMAVLRHMWEWEEGDGNYIAPEVLNAGINEQPTDKADIFSLGVTLYALLTGTLLPTSGEMRFGVNLPFPDDVSCEMRHVVTSLLAKDPAQRPAAQNIYNHAADILNKIRS